MCLARTATTLEKNHDRCPVTSVINERLPANFCNGRRSQVNNGTGGMTHQTAPWRPSRPFFICSANSLPTVDAVHQKNQDLYSQRKCAFNQEGSGGWPFYCQQSPGLHRPRSRPRHGGKGSASYFRILKQVQGNFRKMTS